jgi:chemotaxis protein MotB
VAEAGHELIIVRRHEDEEHEHHSSAWKVAHADFMTAMMAFFLIMWLINVTDDQVRKGISEYFNPIHMSSGSTELKGLNDPGPQPEGERSRKGHAPMPDESMNLIKLSEGHADKAISEKGAAASGAAEAAASEAQAAEAAMAAAEAAGEGAHHSTETAAGATAGAGLAAPKGPDERAAFQDPYAVLAKLANQYAAAHPTSVDVIAGTEGSLGVAGGDVDRDPFDPAYWQLSPTPPARTPTPGRPDSLEGVPPDARPDAAAEASKRPIAEAVADVEVADAPEAEALPAEAQTEPPPELMAQAAAETTEADVDADAEVAPADSSDQPEDVAASADDGEQPEDVAALGEAVAADIARRVATTMAEDAAPELSVTATAEGVIINLTDDADYSMFPIGSAVPDPKVVVLLEEVAKALAEHPGRIVIRGFTDGRPFHSDDYDNWRLSAARAHMAYYMLTRGGLEETRVDAIEGHADRGLKTPEDPYAAENRRIEILLKEVG